MSENAWEIDVFFSMDIGASRLEGWTGRLATNTAHVSQGG